MKITVNKTIEKSKRSVFLGICFILAAVLIVLDALVTDIPLSSFKIIAGVILLAWIVRDLFSRRFSEGGFFLLAFLVMLFEKEIGTAIGRGEDFISNWVLLIVAALLSIGTSFLAPSKTNHTHSHAHVHSKSVHILGDAVKYIDCADFSEVSINNTFGDYDVYFQNTDMYAGGGKVNISNNFGDVNFYVPSDWSVEFALGSSVFSDKTVHGETNANGKVLTITGTSKFGDVNVYTK